MMEVLGNRLLYLDGGMGTMLQAMGLKGGERPESWNLLYPERVEDIHAQYLAAGCDIVTANTFGATRAHLGDEAEALMAAGVRNARRAVEKAGRGWAAVDMGSLGRLLAPYGDMPFEEAVGQFREAFVAGLKANGDLILIETMTDLLEVKAAVLAAKEAMEALDRKVPLFVSLTFDENGRLLTGADIRGTAAMLTGLGVDALGLNCGHEPTALYENVQELCRWSPLPVFVSPNASLPVVKDGVTVFPTTPEAFGRDMKQMVALGAWGLGGCCGTTPAHIAALVKNTKDLAPLPGDAAPLPLVLSGRSASIALGQRPLLIGERINPTGKPRMKQALRQGDMDFLLREAIAQADAGADVLDVNVGLPEVDEAAMLKAAVTAIQTVCDLPLQLDTADPAALEAALRVYAGRPLINSVCGKQKVMDSIFPLAAKYGGALVALTLDEDGIPETAQGRLAIAKRIIKEAAKHGIPKENLLFDALTMTVSTNEQAGQITLETVERLAKELGVKTVLGVSNCSFGLPQRPLITAAFTAMAVSRGLTAAILNPLDATVKTLWDAAAAVSGRDGGFASYLALYGGEGSQTYGVAAAPAGQLAAGAAANPAAPAAAQAGTAAGSAANGRAAQPKPPSGHEMTAQTAIIRGLATEAAAKAQQLLNSGLEPTAVIEQTLMPALSEVGDKYEQGKLFLPQLLQSAAAAQAAFDVIRARLPEGPADDSRRVILATVQGDVHDIGKNIVKVLLQNYGFAVTDLGKDVAPEKVLAAVRDTRATLVGLSALMTTTVPAMKETIALLRREAPQVRVIVGGAVLTEEFAAQLGADGYGKDAMASVRLAQGFLQA